LESLSTNPETDRETNRQRRQVLSIASPFSLAPGTVRVLEPRGGTSAQLVEQLCRGEVTGPFMLDSAGMRHLYFDLTAVQSSMRLENPADLVTAYARKMMAFLLFNRAPREILMIGLGGGSLVKFCHRRLLGTRLTVVEIDPDIVALREWFHIPPDDDRLQVLLEDGADFVRRDAWAADILLIDAFDRAGVAPSLASHDFYAHAFRCLQPDGLLVMNLAGERARYAAHLERLCEACPGPVLLVPVANDGNVLIFAFARRAHPWTSESLEATAEELQSEFALEFPRFLSRLRAGDVLL
jgi:spermidine synthase